MPPPVHEDRSVEEGQDVLRPVNREWSLLGFPGSPGLVTTKVLDRVSHS